MSQVPPGTARAVGRVVGQVELHDPAAQPEHVLAPCRDDHAVGAGVVQDAGVPFMPSIWTTQSRQDPNGFSESVAHRRGMSTPASVAARRTEVPAGTSTSWPSTLTRVVAGPGTAGVP